jgi:hypothetical protein
MGGPTGNNAPARPPCGGAGILTYPSRSILPTKVRRFGIGNSRLFPVEGALDSHLGEQHWSAVFGSIDQHLDRQPAFRRVAL